MKPYTKQQRLTRSIELGIIVDGADIDLLYSYTWYLASVGYPVTTIKRVPFHLHRMVAERMFGEIPRGVVTDHKDGNKLNNSRENLHLVSQKENMENYRSNSSNTSGHKGVTWDKSKNRWAAQLTHNGKCIHLGRYKDKLEAAEMALIARQVYFSNNLR